MTWTDEQCESVMRGEVEGELLASLLDDEAVCDEGNEAQEGMSMARGKRGPRPEVVTEPDAETVADDMAEALATPVDDADTGDVDAEPDDADEDADEDPEQPAGETKPEPKDTGERTPAGEKIFAKSCEVKLSAEERLRKAVEWEAAAIALEKLEGDKAKTMAEFNASLKAQREAVRRLREEFSTAREQRMVSLVERPNWDNKRMELYRVEGGELEESRAMTPAELQRPLDFGGHAPESVMANPDTNPVATAATAA